ncbi:REP-associated tyrosine transposase [Roseospira navarrensis]|uniref:Transposase n=1 Tax=Roseospira navarrensis TaxID=140058 RepID=A0A7X1ZDA1_9PROT|nr:transposase [Roseospira navarrensis]MQX35115.1 transposase [Roseospira navarrensis]
MPNYRRNRVPGASYFFTVALLERRKSLLVDHIDVLRQCVQQVRTQRPFYIDAWVVLPDHMHCIWTLPGGDADYATRWRLIKLLFSKALPATETLSSTRQRRSERGLWQRRYWEHTIRSDSDFARHVDYVHFNPVRHGHATWVKDWPYSTFHRFVGNGVLDPDWAGDVGNLPTAPE